MPKERIYYMVNITREQIKSYIFAFNDGVYRISCKGMRKVVHIYKNTHKCEICDSNKDLTFHHTLPKRKQFTISDLISHHSDITVRQFLRELNQCQLLCRHCHDKVHGIKPVKGCNMCS
jgi:5-methylcytosine-specific restriction endonuclease McrA